MLTLVSEFNCLLRGRCSIEMWCPDDTGRDGWEWVGPPAWGRACFNSPEWGGGSSPVKTEPPQIALLLLLWLWLWSSVFIHETPMRAPNQVWQNAWESRLQATPPPPSPRRRRTLRHRGLKNGHSRPCWRSAKNAAKCGKNPTPPIIRDKVHVRTALGDVNRPQDRVHHHNENV